MTLAEALAGKEIPESIRNTLSIVTVPYFSFDATLCEGELVVHQDLAEEIKSIFEELSKLKFPIRSIVPVAAYGWDDDASMAANNTSAFNYRHIHGTERLSNHSYGRAVDINPALNPYVLADGTTLPSGASYDPNIPGTITREVAELFIRRGWDWGGNWATKKDWQHFEKS